MDWFRQRKLKRLIQAKMDGRLASDQEMELNQLLKKSGYRRDDFDRFMALQTQLDNLKSKDEQIEVSTRVMQAILKKEQAKKKTARSENVMSWFIGYSALRLATVMLVGILLGSAITWMLLDDSTKLDKDLLRGSMMDNELQSISFMQQSTVVKMIPYTLEKLYYLNFFIESPEDLLIEVSFSHQDFVPRKSDFIELQGAHTINTGVGSISFSAKGRATVLLILEKSGDSRAQITVGVKRNKVHLFNKQLFFN